MPKLSGRRLRAAVVDPQTEWSRRKLQVLLVAGAMLVLAVIGGGVWSVVGLLGVRQDGGGTDASAASGSREDRLAQTPLPEAPLEAAQPGNLSSAETGTMQVPASTKVGPAAVATGFPHTSEGALAQLAAIDQAAISSASVRVAQEVIRAWAAPGGPTPQNWSGVDAVAGLLGSAGMPSDGSGGLTVSVEPSMGFIKGTVGEDFVVPCIDFIITATTVTGHTQRVAAADCQRMVWQDNGSSDGRWVVGPGEEPAPAPSLWPGSQRSFEAGYEWLEIAP